jgi:hypothetical protein
MTVINESMWEMLTAKSEVRNGDIALYGSLTAKCAVNKWDTGDLQRIGPK